MDGPPTDPARANESHLAQILAVQTIVVFLALLCVALRLYVRIKMIKSVGSDDWTVTGAAGFHGLGRHVEFISAEDRVKLGQAKFWQVIISSAVGMALLKISVGLNLLRLSPSRWYVWCLWISIAFVSAYSFMAAMTFFLHCDPMQAHWDYSIKGAKCYSIDLFITFALINTAFNIFTDVLFASIPIPIIWKLQMKRKVRIYLIGILSLGYIAVAFGVTNGVFQISFKSITDPYFNDWIMFFAVLQVNTGMIAACAPSLKPLANSALKLSGYYGTSRTPGTSGRQYGSRYASNSSGLRASRPRPAGWRDQYGLEELQSSDRHSDEIQLKSDEAKYSATATFYNAAGSGSDEDRTRSDDHVEVDWRRRRNNGDGKGILLTTEVTVQ
ncbi:hypothetical protein PHISP_04358 [Aspergillus sp. HF37]|nr:hypothetical protein PHISP_04358 [Aspergillus sp. HF37]